MLNSLSPHEVVDRLSFAAFVEQLKQELITNPTAWENKTLIDFLEALSRYAQDIDGYYQNVHPNIKADEPTWRVFADLLKGATMYE